MARSKRAGRLVPAMNRSRQWEKSAFDLDRDVTFEGEAEVLIGQGLGTPEVCRRLEVSE